MADQPLGQLLSKEEADKQFGPVLSGVEMESTQISSLFAKSDNVLMFNIINGQAVVLGNGRKVLFPEDANIDSETVFHVYGISILQELLEKGNSPVSSLEMRKDVFSITNGATTLEFSANCPPYCW